MKKTDAERANINARAAISAAKTRATKLKAIQRWLIEPGHPIATGTLVAFGHSEYMRGFDAGVRDAGGEED